jgi:hypothetical protein
LPKVWCAEHLLHPDYSKDFTSCTAEEWRRWISSGRSGLAAKSSRNAISDLNSQASLREWRPEQELLDRPQVVDAASAFIDGLKVSRHGSDSDAYRLLTDIAPEFLREFIRTDGLAVDRYYRETLTRAGEVQSNRRTIPLVGALTNRKNVERLLSALSYATRKTARPDHIIWVKPQVPYWGATRIVLDTLRQLKKSLLTTDAREEPDTICMVTGRSEIYLDRSFDGVIFSNTPQFPNAVEVLLIPGVLTVVLVHAPIGAQSGLAVPLGILSFDPRVVERVQDEVAARIGGYIVDDTLFHSLRRDLALQDDSADEPGAPAPVS